MIARLWPGLAVAIILLGAFFWLRGCGNSPDVDSSQKIENALQSGWDSAKRADLPIISRLKIHDDSLGHQLDQEKSRRLAAEQNLKTRKSNALQTVSRLDSARAARDTAAQLHQGIELENQVKAGIPAIEAYDHLTDSMINDFTDRMAIKDSIIFFQGKMLKKADTTITAQQVQYEIIHRAYDRKTMQLKFYKPVAIGGVATAAILIALKLISH